MKTTGRPAKTDEEKIERGERVKALRLALKVTAQAAANRADIDRTKWSKFETGVNAVTTAGAQSAVAAGLGVSRDDLVEYIDGRIELSTMLEHCEMDRRYPAMIVVRKAAAIDGLEKYLGTFSVDLKSDAQPTSAMLVTMFMDHVAREKGKAVPERGDALGGIRKPKRR